jgi:hypothetical protein
MGSVRSRRGSGGSLGTSRVYLTCQDEGVLMGSGIRLEDIFRLYLLHAMMGRQGNKYANSHTIY